MGRGNGEHRFYTVGVGIKLKFDGKESKNEFKSKSRSMDKIDLDIGTDVLHSDL